MTARSLVAELATDPSPEEVLALLAECSLPAHTGASPSPEPSPAPLACFSWTSPPLGSTPRYATR